jgi:hypothetical protein
MRSVASALCLLAAALLAGCGQPQPSTQAAIGQDIAAARGSTPHVVSPVPPPSVAAAATPAPPPESGKPLPGGGGGLTGRRTRGDVHIGRDFALANCRPCHVVAANQASPVRFANAPDFRTIANDPHTTELGLRIWLTNPHPTMPTLRLTAQEASNVIAYLESLRRSR